jgi:hypothetical protein
MRITRELLLKNAEETVQKRVAQEKHLLAAYLCGSLLRGREPLLGGTADIDLVLIYADASRPREIVRLTDEVHIDIQHHSRAQYEPARDLREQAWLGHTVFTCQPLYDTDHFFDFVQAGARSMFEESEYRWQRAQPFWNAARAAWFNFYNDLPANAGAEEVAGLLAALEDLGNGLACLNGAPLPERRFLLELPDRTAALGVAELTEAIAGLLGIGEIERDTLIQWLPAWQAAFLEANQPAPRLNPQRLNYYRAGIESLAIEGNLSAALWPLLRTWTDAVRGLPAGHAALESWRAAAAHLRLVGGEESSAFALRVNGLDAVLDRAEEFAEGWKKQHGV